MVLFRAPRTAGVVDKHYAPLGWRTIWTTDHKQHMTAFLSPFAVRYPLCTSNGINLICIHILSYLRISCQDLQFHFWNFVIFITCVPLKPPAGTQNAASLLTNLASRICRIPCHPHNFWGAHADDALICASGARAGDAVPGGRGNAGGAGITIVWLLLNSEVRT